MLQLLYPLKLKSQPVNGSHTEERVEEQTSIVMEENETSLIKEVKVKKSKKTTAVKEYKGIVQFKCLESDGRKTSSKVIKGNWVCTYSLLKMMPAR